MEDNCFFGHGNRDNWHFCHPIIYLAGYSISRMVGSIYRELETRNQFTGTSGNYL
jgi:hypothetical protein